MNNSAHTKNLPPCYGIIPARYASTRFPGKPLADILGKPMIWHVYQRARQCPYLKKVVVATDDDRIMLTAEALRIPAVLTRFDHESGTDRVMEAAQQLRIPKNAVVVNIQGDEPALEPEMLTQLLSPFSNPKIRVSTLARPIPANEAQVPDLVKVVFSEAGSALYFSRAMIPYHRDEKEKSYYGHIGLYAFRMEALEKFVSLPPSPLERLEKLEQLRLLENNIPIHVEITRFQSIGVDRPEDIPRASRMLAEMISQSQEKYSAE